MKKVLVELKKMHPDAVVPAYATEGASGFDFVSIDNAIIYPGQTTVINTGLAMAVPEGYELQVRPRSGLSLKTGLRIANSPGSVDQDFRGIIGIIVTNVGTNPHKIERGMRIAQGVVAPVVRAEFMSVSELSTTTRGTGGFGSTGE